MNTKARIKSIQQCSNLDSEVTGQATFDLSNVRLLHDLDIELPTNLRLGHLAEKVVAELFKASSNYQLLYENIQVLEGNRTVGELDFLVKDVENDKTIHVELAYKFYLFDPSISSQPINNWIGPNRNDSLKQKLDKLKEKQFPLLYYPSVKSILPTIDIGNTSQALCLLASLFIPYNYKGTIDPMFQSAVEGYYFDFGVFKSLDEAQKVYYLPNKTEWGMDPACNENWETFSDLEQEIKHCLEEKQAPLVWQRNADVYVSYFVVWW